MPLADAAIRRARPSDNPQKISDGGGLLYLYLYLTPTGARSWRWKYRIAGKEKLLSIGLYPDVSLARAREARDEARRLQARGVDPGVQRKAAALAHSALGSDSFETIANEWLATRPWVPSYAEKIEAWMKYDAWPWIGSRSVADLTALDFLRVARRIEDRGAIESAHRIMQNCGQIMRYAVATGRAERNPVADLKGALAPAKEAHTRQTAASRRSRRRRRIQCSTSRTWPAAGSDSRPRFGFARSPGFARVVRRPSAVDSTVKGDAADDFRCWPAREHLHPDVEIHHGQDPRTS